VWPAESRTVMVTLFTLASQMIAVTSCCFLGGSSRLTGYNPLRRSPP
jgi:hypothetical protein